MNFPYGGLAVDIHPRGAFHVGELGVGREETLAHVPSDTLYAALVSAWVALGEQGPFDPAPLRITSAFPRVGDVRLYPHPLVRIHAAEAQRDELGKTISKFAWCSERVFAKLLHGEDMTDLAVQESFEAGIWFHPDDRPGLPSSPRGADKVWHRDATPALRFWATKPPVPHVAINRLNNAPNLFHSGRVSFGPGCGLWFGVEYEAPDAAARLERALHYLADAGLGGLRSTGHGGFTFTMKEVAHTDATPDSGGGDIPTPHYAVTLARHLPASPQEVTATLQAAHAAYRLVTVGGWCQDDAGHPWRRKQVRLVVEGSVIGWPGGVPGQIADVVPQGVGQFAGRPVLRYGRAFPVPVAEEALL